MDAKTALKYLFGIGIHKDCKIERQEIKHSKFDTLETKVSKTRMSYVKEGLRYGIRLSALAVEAGIIYGAMTGFYDPTNMLFYWMYSGLTLRIGDLLFSQYRNMEKADQEAWENMNEGFNRFHQQLLNELLNGAAAGATVNNSNNGAEYARALKRGKLLADPHAVLGIKKDATPDEAKKAYRNIAMECHSDRNGGDTSKNDRFIEAQKAYYQLIGKFDKL